MAGMPKVMPLSDRAWAGRVEAVLALLAKHPGATFAELRQRAPWGPWMLRNVLAAAEPRAVGRGGRWWRAEDCSRRVSPPVPRVGRPVHGSR